VKPFLYHSNFDWLLFSFIIFSSFSFGFGGDANKLGVAAAVVVGGAFGGDAVVFGGCAFGSR
jgi:hypothetical protein